MPCSTSDDHPATACHHPRDYEAVSFSHRSNYGMSDSVTFYRVISQQICDVETQVIVFEQFRGGLRNFRSDLRRQSGHNVGFDSNIALLALQLFNQDGTFNNKDFGFKGTDVGKNLRVPSGNNWDDSKSPKSIDDILQTIGNSRNSSVPQSSTNGTVSSA